MLSDYCQWQGEKKNDFLRTKYRKSDNDSVIKKQKGTAIRMRKDNRGLTLIELVVTVAIAMVFSGVILTFVAGASKSYRRTSAGAQSQIEMQDALDQIENLTISTNLSMYYTKGINKNTNITADQKIANDSDMDRPLAQSKTLFFGSQSEDGTKSYYSIIWNAEKKTLYYFSQILKQNSGTGTGETSGTGTGGIGGGSSVGTEQVLAKNVTQFAADIHHASDQHTVRFKIVTQVNDREVEKTETVTLRNDVVIAAPGRETAE